MMRRLWQFRAAMRARSGGFGKQHKTIVFMPADAPVATVYHADNGLDFVTVLSDSLSCAVVVFNDQHKVTGFNLRAEQLTNAAASQVIGQGIESLPEPLQSPVKQAFATGQADHAQFMLRNGKGERISISASATPLWDDGKISGCVLVANDITAVRKWEGNMRRLDRLHSVGTLSASMAHEIKNAFVAVRTFVDLLLEKQQGLELGELVRQELGRIEALVGQMLKFSGPPRPAMTSIHLHFVLGKSMLLVQHLLEEKKIQMTRAFGASTDAMEGDADQLEQAFLNLFFNAIDATDAGGRLEISTESLPANTTIEGLTANGQPYLKVVIRDSGVGIPAENMLRLYEPFFTTKSEGTGLGLAITRRIIHEHQGTITVQSEPDKGTAFTLVFPTRG